MVWGRDIIFKIDNTAVMYGWYSGYVSNGKCASEILRSVQLLAGIMGVRVHVKHVVRMSDDLVTGLGIRSFQKNLPFFPFFSKEPSVLSVLFRSL